MRKWTIRQFEWYRDNKILLPSQTFCLRRFFYSKKGTTDVIDERFSLLAVTEGWQLQSVETTIFHTEKEKKIMKKKIVTVLLTAVMVTAMAAGCGGSKSSDSGSDRKSLIP